MYPGGVQSYLPVYVWEKKVFDALDWLAAVCSHVPNKGEQRVRHYGHYGNVGRSKRKKRIYDVLIYSMLSQMPRLDAYSVFIEHPEIIKKIF